MCNIVVDYVFFMCFNIILCKFKLWWDFDFIIIIWSGVLDGGVDISFRS